ncbi:MAG: hypothetical protein EAZ30_15580 [Betaproteobacteria bacterium]|nr:MAG: hypothetical protein EAZ30_15580 [Betaproteobacteria bacterium]
MKRDIDSQQGRRTYSKCMGTVESVFANVRHNKQLNRFTLRGRCKVGTQWQLYCMGNNGVRHDKKLLNLTEHSCMRSIRLSFGICRI